MNFDNKRSSEASILSQRPPPSTKYILPSVFPRVAPGPRDRSSLLSFDFRLCRFCVLCLSQFFLAFEFSAPLPVLPLCFEDSFHVILVSSTQPVAVSFDTRSRLSPASNSVRAAILIFFSRTEAPWTKFRPKSLSSQELLLLPLQQDMLWKPLLASYTGVSSPARVASIRGTRMRLSGSTNYLLPFTSRQRTWSPLPRSPTTSGNIIRRRTRLAIVEMHCSDTVKMSV